ncbi:MAG: hypothetical protein BGO43_11720 [Gammaproteobacteria bacterium 39-13]|nr:methyltransferase domain-containing protein [Gammaproteobacteria bacterium]OJV85292.1 MAG: hypothetical protein BGO43_11720 [Gammaproteobacteria bacterium 39-13]
MQEISRPQNHREIMEFYYHLIAGGVRLRLLESVIDFNLPELIGESTLTEAEIIEKLELSPQRAKKWLYLLTTERFLTLCEMKEQNTNGYCLGPVLKVLCDNVDKWWFFKQMDYSWRSVAYENTNAILQGAPITYDVNWPPSTPEDSLLLEEWMHRTALTAITILQKYFPRTKPKTLLDVGGGDSTIACYFAHKYPDLHFTIYNLPEAIKLATQRISKEKLEDRIHLVTGNFLEDESFPLGFDIVLFSRVLCDWPEDVCQKLLTMAYNALNEGGTLIICEPFKELNQDFLLVWEFRYMFWDNFGKAVFKESTLYQRMLTEIGFKDFEFSPVDDEGIYRVLKAKK